MNIFTHIINKLFNRNDQVNVLSTIDKSKGKSVLTEDIQVQVRNSSDTPPVIIQNIIDICKDNTEIERCHILDVHDPNGAPPQTKNFIVIATDNNELQMDGVALKIQEMLQEPPYSKNCFITASDTFPDIYEKPEYAVYIREK